MTGTPHSESLLKVYDKEQGGIVGARDPVRTNLIKLRQN
jgi:hypothetical protein